MNINFIMLLAEEALAKFGKFNTEKPKKYLH